MAFKVQFYSTWRTAVKLAWEVPRSTHTYMLDHLLAAGITTSRTEILSRYSGFFKNLRCSASAEVQLLALMVGRDLRTTTGRNLRFISEEANIDPWEANTWKFRKLLNENKSEVPITDRWRLPYLSKLLEERQKLHYQGEDKTRIQELINSVCTN